MTATEAQTGVVALLEACAQQRAGAVSVYSDDTSRLARAAQAETAGRELLGALIRTEPWPNLSLGASIRRMIGYLQTVISASTPDTEIPPMLIVHAHHVELSVEIGRLLRNAALCLVLAAYDDGAKDVDLLIEGIESGAILRVESSRPAITGTHTALMGLREHIAQVGGAWDDQRALHGQSWIVVITVPTMAAMEAGQ